MLLRSKRHFQILTVIGEPLPQQLNAMSLQTMIFPYNNAFVRDCLELTSYMSFLVVTSLP